MKKLQIILLAMLFPFFAFSQIIVEKSESISKSQTLKLDFQFADLIIIKTWNKSEVNVKVSVSINDNEDNDRFKLNVIKKNDFLKFESEIENMKELAKKNRYVVKEDEDGEYYVCNGESIEMDLVFEVFAPGSVELQVSTISGNIDLVDWKGPAEISTISGYIDATIDPKLKADFELSTISGEMYSDLNLDITNRDKAMRCIVGGDVEATLNNGGVAMVYETISGDIYLRRK